MIKIMKTHTYGKGKLWRARKEKSVVAIPKARDHTFLEFMFANLI